MIVCRAPELHIAGVYSYGSPKWSDQATADRTAQRYPGRIFRYVHAADLVCQALVVHAQFPSAHTLPATYPRQVIVFNASDSSIASCALMYTGVQAAARGRLRAPARRAPHNLIPCD